MRLIEETDPEDVLACWELVTSCSQSIEMFVVGSDYIAVWEATVD